jgi:CubicO group peptidase (beta-lactamase class C family)
LIYKNIIGWQWVALVVGAIILASSQGCLPVRALFLTSPDHNDSKRFDSAIIKASEQPFHFYTANKRWEKQIKINDWTTDLPVFSAIEDVVAEHNTSAMVIIRNDTILTEYFKEDRPADEKHASYSMAKSVTSALVGIAIQEGYIGNVDELVKQYLPELNFHPYFDKLTIRHLLNHTSGIKYSLTVDAFIYYGKDVWKGIKQIDFDTLPGTKQSYLNTNSQLLGIVLERATKTTASQYLQSKLWQPLGMESDAFWSADNKGQAKTYCCLNATAYDYAKFGRLYLNNGNWQGKQIINEAWVKQSIARDTTQGSSYGYNFSWHIGLEGYNDFMAIGLYKQHIYINPEKHLIIVLLNHKEDKLKAERINWWYVFRQIADQL